MKNILISFLLLIPSFGYSQKSGIDTLTFCLRPDGVAAGGYDVVSYFQANTPKIGKPELTAIHDGISYRFSSEENLQKFFTNPNKYIPQFGGWCSMTLVMGRATKPTYDNFAILSDKLYLFERTLSVNGKELWLKDVKGNEKIATKNYTSYSSTGKIK